MAAQDYKNPTERSQKLRLEIEALHAVGLTASELDLRNYFGDNLTLEADITSYDFIWVRGGNVFTLRHAMALSGLDKMLSGLLKAGKLLYGGYSAGACVLAPSLKGLQLVDPLDRPGRNYPPIDTIWEGLGLLDYAFVPHYKSDHPESADIDKYVVYLQQNNMPYEALHDGEVIIIDSKAE